MISVVNRNIQIFADYPSSGPPREFAGPGAKLYLSPLGHHYFQTTRLKTGGQYSH